MKNKIAVIGAGASGLMAAITAAECGSEVTIYELNDRPGRKLLLTGSGKCNLTHDSASAEHYSGSVGRMADRFLDRFSSADTVDFFNENGLIMYDRDGYIYPYSFQAASVSDILMLTAERLQVRFITGAEVTEVIPQNSRFRLALTLKNGKKTVTAGETDHVVIACGGKAAPATGSQGQGYILAEKLGHRIIPVYPALCGLKCAERDCRDAGRVRQRGTVSLFSGNKKIAEDTGEIQFTDYGLSGIPVFNVSRYASVAQGSDGQDFSCSVDLIPFMGLRELTAFLEKKVQNCPDIDAGRLTSGTVNMKIAAMILKHLGIRPDTKASQLGADMLEKTAYEMKNMGYHISGINSFAEAQTSTGGISMDEINAGLESVICPGVYFTGEMLDIDGQCGGYNLQWAWTSGHIAGLGAAGK